MLGFTGGYDTFPFSIDVLFYGLLKLLDLGISDEIFFTRHGEDQICEDTLFLYERALLLVEIYQLADLLFDVPHSVFHDFVVAEFHRQDSELSLAYLWVAITGKHS